MKSFTTHIEEAKTPKPSAVWVLGGAASGKSTIAEQAIVKGLGFELIDTDEPLDKMLKKFGLSMTISLPKPKTAEQKANAKKPVKMADLDDPMDFFKTSKPTVTRARVVANEITKRKNADVTSARKNVVFVETGGNLGAVANKKKLLEDQGYKTFAIMVGVQPMLDLSKDENFQRVFDTIQDRSNKRLSGGGRTVDPKILKSSLLVTQKVRDKLMPVFGKNKLFIDTSSGDPRKNIAKTKRAIQTWMKK
ncbi:MAG: hypothetical protein HOE30_10450 [Deltaproteobacteria bacterium]|jgi:hypothetical protein|nr:hypothetical protein [Deltaproteobacteria bacterium]